LEFSTDIVPGIIIDADAVRYAQVLINLLSNALKYTAKGNVSLSLRRGEKLAELLISDSGEGIALEVVKNIISRSAQSF
jgi:signal transduction histidine kinase